MKTDLNTKALIDRLLSNDAQSIQEFHSQTKEEEMAISYNICKLSSILCLFRLLSIFENSEPHLFEYLRAGVLLVSSLLAIGQFRKKISSEVIQVQMLSGFYVCLLMSIYLSASAQEQLGGLRICYFGIIASFLFYYYCSSSLKILVFIILMNKSLILYCQFHLDSFQFLYMDNLAILLIAIVFYSFKYNLTSTCKEKYIQGKRTERALEYLMRVINESNNLSYLIYDGGEIIFSSSNFQNLLTPKPGAPTTNTISLSEVQLDNFKLDDDGVSKSSRNLEGKNPLERFKNDENQSLLEILNNPNAVISIVNKKDRGSKNKTIQERSHISQLDRNSHISKVKSRTAKSSKLTLALKVLEDYKFLYLGVFHFNGFSYDVSIRLSKSQHGEFFEIEIYDVSSHKAEYDKLKEEITKKQAIISKVLHEFKTPLSCISALGDTIMERLDCSKSQGLTEKEDLSKSLVNISSTCEYTSLLMTDFIRVCKNEEISVVKQPVDMEKLMNFCFNALKVLNLNNGDKVSLELVVCEELDGYEVYTDSMRMKQLIINLVSNSVKFTKFGSITLELKFVTDDSLALVVKDTGLGLNPEQMEIIKSKRFNDLKVDRTINSMGSGIGLSVCMNIIEKLGYNLDITSKLGAGTEFTILMVDSIRKKSIATIINSCPINMQSLLNYMGRKKRSSLTNRYTRSTTTNWGSPTKNPRSISSNMISLDEILLVDDNALIRQAMKKQLEKIFNEAGKVIQIREGSDGVDILNYVIKDQGNGNVIKLVLSDECMNYINGSQAVKFLMDINKDCKMYNLPKFVCFSGHDESYKNQLMDSGFDEIIKKNCSKQDLHSLLSKYDLL